MSTKTRHSAKRLALYGLATGVAATSSGAVSAAVERLDLSGDSFPIVLDEDSDNLPRSLVINNPLDNPTVDPIGTSFNVGVYNYYIPFNNDEFTTGATLFHSLPGSETGIPDVCQDCKYMGFLQCGSLVDGSLRGLGGVDNEHDSGQIWAKDNYRIQAGKRGFIGVRFTGPDPSGSGTNYATYYGYLDVEVQEGNPEGPDGNDELNPSITIHGGAVESTPGKSIRTDGPNCLDLPLLMAPVNAAVQ